MLNTLLDADFKKSFIEVPEEISSQFPQHMAPKRPLRPDGIDKQKMLAFEFHGAQHFRTTTQFNKTEADLERSKALDAMKELTLKKMGYQVIIIDGRNAKTENLYKSVTKALDKGNFKYDRALKLSAEKIWDELVYLKKAKSNHIPEFRRRIISDHLKNDSVAFKV